MWQRTYCSGCSNHCKIIAILLPVFLFKIAVSLFSLLMGKGLQSYVQGPPARLLRHWLDCWLYIFIPFFYWCQMVIKCKQYVVYYDDWKMITFCCINKDWYFPMIINDVIDNVTFVLQTKYKKIENDFLFVLFLFESETSLDRLISL
jgi:hypothetical protein